MKRLLHASLLATALLALAPACNRQAQRPTQVAAGLRFVAQEASFDAFFSELFDLQLLLAAAPADERQLRVTLASSLGVTDGTTPGLLAERVATRSLELKDKGLQLRLEIEGWDAVDPADTSAQTRVVGTLDDAGRKTVEAVTLATRGELALMARLRRARSSVELLNSRAMALEPLVEGTFVNQPAHLESVRRNLDDTKRVLPLLASRAATLAEESKRFASRLATALTTHPQLSTSPTPPLVTSEPARALPPRPAPARGGPARPAAKPKPASAAPSSDFEP